MRKLTLSVTLAVAALIGLGAKPGLTEEQKIHHALDRLTFGARPGEMERIKAQGLQRWLDGQLHPERIAESKTLEAQLAPLESLRLNDRELLASYPPNQLLKAIAKGRDVNLPPERRAMLERLAERYEEKQKLGKAKKDAKQEDEPAMTPEDRQARFREGDQEKLASLLTPDQLRTLRRGTPDEKLAVLNAIEPGKLGEVVEAMPAGLRRQAAKDAPTELRRKLLYAVAPSRVMEQDLVTAKLLRAAYSERQLQEVLTDFWFNHFNVSMGKNQARPFVLSYERDAIRPYVLGKFRDLLGATAHHPAMLAYLDNAQSVAPGSLDRMGNGRMLPQQMVQRLKGRGLNENYARELMELHTLGVDGGYTQQDVTEVARCLTGWSVALARQGETGFVFRPRLHDDGAKRVLGTVIPAGGGEQDGERVLDLLARHPATAKFISRKLAQRFVADEPPAALVDRMAQTFTKTDGDLRAVVRTMVDAPEFWSPAAVRAKVKSPLEMVVSAVRALDAQVSHAEGLAQVVRDLGQPLYRKQEPTGYGNTGAEWVNSAALLARLNFALNLAQNKVPGVTIDPQRFGTEGDLARIAQSVLMTDLSPASRAVIERGLQERQGQAPTPQLMAGLVLGSPEFQRR